MKTATGFDYILFAPDEAPSTSHEAQRYHNNEAAPEQKNKPSFNWLPCWT